MIKLKSDSLNNSDVLHFIRSTSRPFFNQKIVNWQYSNEHSRLFYLSKEGEICGTQGMIFHELISTSPNEDKKVILSSKSETTFVSDNLRGTGSFEILYERAVQYTIDDKQTFIWGFTALSKVWRNKLRFFVDETIIYESFLKIGFENDGNRTIKSLVKKTMSIFSLWIVMIKISTIKLSKIVRFKEQKNISDILPKLQESLNHNSDTIELLFSQNYCKWRLENNPNLEYKLFTIEDEYKNSNGYVIFTIDKNHLRISDFNIIDPSCINEILIQIIKIGRKEKVNKVTFFGNINNKTNKLIFDAFERLGGKKELNTKMNLVVKSNVLNVHITNNELKKWRITGLWTEGFTY